MIQEPNIQKQQDTTYMQSINCVSATNPNLLSGTKPNTLTGTTNTIPIVINTDSNQSILLITTRASPVNQKQIQNQVIIPKTKIIRVPFLPRSESATPLTKQTLPIKNVLGLNTKYSQIQTVNTLTDTDYCYKYPKQIRTTTTSTQTENQTQVQAQSQPMTLAAMTGIQLTGAEESYTDVSGAMPTATVEEINVPVFIDEYLQQSTETFLTTAATSATNFNTDNNYNNRNTGNGNGNEIYIENEIFENFDFDINMIADKDSQIEEQIYNNYSNNHNSNMENYVNNNFYNNNNNSDNYNYYSNIDCSSAFNFVCKEEFDDAVQLDEYLNADLLNDSTMIVTDEAVDIRPLINEDELSFPLTKYMTSSQNNPMLCDAISNSTTNSQTLILTAEPILPDCDDAEMEQYTKFNYNSQYKDDELMINNLGESKEKLVTECKFENEINDAIISNNSTNSCSVPQNYPEKRFKLQLNTSHFIPSIGQELIKTPDVINNIIEMSNIESKMSIKNQSMKEIFNDLVNVSNSSFGESVTTEFYESIIIDDEPPCTPQSFSSCSRTNYTTSPNSPAPSIASTTTTTTSATQNSSNKRKRGRPSKEHSDRPDPKKLSVLNEVERKRAEDRAKNNEASRLSRRKNKEREEGEMKDEHDLKYKHEILSLELEELQSMERKLRKVAYKKFATH